jgi:hypothetical protein
LIPSKKTFTLPYTDCRLNPIVSFLTTNRIITRVERRGQAVYLNNKWVKQMARQVKEHKEQTKEHKEKMEKRTTPGLQLRRMKLTAEEKRKLEAKILGNSDERHDKGMRRK